MTAQRDGWTTTGAWATTAEVAAYLSVEISTIQFWARSGKLPATRLGSKYGPLRFRKLEVERWVTKQPRAAS